MDKVLKVVGIVWTAIGVSYLAQLDTETSDAILGFGILLGMMVYVLPGLVVAGIGYGISKRVAASTADERHSAATDPTRKCPFCAETIKLEAKVCRYCGRDLADEQQVEVTHKHESSEQAERASPIRRVNVDAVEAASTRPENLDAVRWHREVNFDAEEAAPARQVILDALRAASPAKRYWPVLLIAVVVGILAWGVFRETRSPSREHEAQKQERAEVARLAAMTPEERAAEETRNAEAEAEIQKRREEEADLARRSMLRSQGLIWTYRDVRDELSGKMYRVALLKSSNTVEFDSPYDGAQRAQIHLQSDPKAAALEIERGQFVCGYDSCDISVAFDDGVVQQFSAFEPSDGRTTILVFRNYARFIKQLRAAKEVRLAATVYQEGSPTFTFNVEGLDWGPAPAPPPPAPASASLRTPSLTQGMSTRVQTNEDINNQVRKALSPLLSNADAAVIENVWLNHNVRPTVACGRVNRKRFATTIDGTRVRAIDDYSAAFSDLYSRYCYIQ